MLKLKHTSFDFQVTHQLYHVLKIKTTLWLFTSFVFSTRISGKKRDIFSEKYIIPIWNVNIYLYFFFYKTGTSSIFPHGSKCENYLRKGNIMRAYVHRQHTLDCIPLTTWFKPQWYHSCYHDLSPSVCWSVLWWYYRQHLFQRVTRRIRWVCICVHVGQVLEHGKVL